ncbi:beta strand repeat-containing protein [Actinoplanes sp. RD1]|uniref:beta strand repeat-containing protein n=1 Tax=Actinoplanes sp. RD1 TaxID=3064538 RepID=UPI00274157F2|nr:Calx-beta domain-containing protein [Actinoplanes sp. RD1]
MRYKPAHASKSGSVPFALRGPKSAKTILSAAVAGVIGLVPTVLLSSPAMADTHGYITVTAGAASVTEGGTVTFTIANADTASHNVALTWTGGTAANPADFTFTPTSPVTVAAGSSATVTVTTIADNTYEGAETITMRGEVDSTNYGVASVTLNDGDAVPTYTLSATPDPVLESTTTPTATITATLNRAVAGSSTVITLNTVDGTAKAGTDYTALTNGTLTIAAGQTTGTATVNITKDTVYDTADVESFTVNSTSAGTVQAASTAAGSTTVNIRDAQSAPVVSITGGGNVNEGSTVNFSLGLDHGSERATSVDWDAAATAAQTNQATPGSDFTYPATRTVTIPALQTTGSIAVNTLRDSLSEPDEYFDVTLRNPVNATISGTNNKATATITQGADAPKVTITPTSVTEGDSGKQSATFTATLSSASTQTVQVKWSTQTNGSGLTYALPGKDYVDATGTLTFAPGVTTQTFQVDILGDKIDEGSGASPAATDGETFNIKLDVESAYAQTVNLSDPGANRTVKITDDDATPTLVFADKVAKEGNEAGAWLMPVSLSNPSDHPISVTVAVDSSVTTGDLAAAGDIGQGGVSGLPGGHDYTLLNFNSITIPAEGTSAYPVVLVNGDTINEPDETLPLKVTPDAGSAGASFLAAATAKTAKAVIQNDDAVPDLEINSVTGKEGDTVTVTGTLTGWRQGDASAIVTFSGGSSKGSVAASDNDFTNPGATVVSIPWGASTGSTLKVADLKLSTDTTAEPAETIIAKGTGVNNTATVTEGIVTIAANGTTTPPAGAPTLKSAASFRLGAGDLKLTGTAANGATLKLWGKPVGAPADADWEELGSTTASASGAYEFMPEFTTTGWWFKTNDGTNDSNTIKVNLKEDPDITARSSSKGAVTVNVAGDPKIRGLAVRVLRAPAGTDNWVTVGTGIINKDGTYTRTWTGQKSGSKWVFRAYVYGDADTGVLTNWKDSGTVTVR